MAPELRCLLLLTLLGWVAAAGIGAPPRQGETARRVTATESKAAVLPCGGTGALYGDPPTQLSLSWLWRDPRGQELLSLNVTLGEPPPHTRMGIGAQGSLVLPSVSTSDAGVYSCQWDGDSGGNVLLNVPGSRELYISGTQGGQVVLLCAAGNATAVDWFRDANNGTHQFDRAGPRHRPNGSSLLIERLESGDAGQYRCQAGSQNWTVHLHLGGEPSFSVLAGDTARLPCNGSMPSGWVQGSLAWKRLGPGVSWQQLVELAARRYGASKFQLTLDTGAALVLPAVTLDQAGTYHCVRGNHSHAVELEVTARTGGWQPWIVGAAALGYVAIGLASLFGYYQIRRALQTRRRRKRLMDPARRFFKVTGNGAHTPYGNVLPLADIAGVGQTNAMPYENMALDARGQGRPLPAEGPISTVESEDGDGYENTNGDMKLCMGDKESSAPATRTVWRRTEQEATGLQTLPTTQMLARAPGPKTRSLKTCGCCCWVRVRSRSGIGRTDTARALLAPRPMRRWPGPCMQPLSGASGTAARRKMPIPTRTWRGGRAASCPPGRGAWSCEETLLGSGPQGPSELNPPGGGCPGA
ncbi:B-lymphocyte antigen CD19 isoform X6 [Mauremys reevesii]|uniref:B-lymphocyte antigen CD19 isoform X6 n=1 Tax=Mauremys reevesii TaxID=260615 RepID=UPI00193F0899|nr:B-lymphocyte antigen CD19 isoform X6 [Mauremys reevesii]